MTDKEKEVDVTEKPKRERSESKAQESPTENKKQSLIYVGPTIPGLATFSVHNNGIAESVKKKFNSTPELEVLFVDVLEFSQAYVDVKQAGTTLYSAYKVVEAKGGNL